ncbi:MAG TPA: AraC family transcriptional regulator ligand-binding domain-containing protein, partial [Polyangiaceae bacterium]|nr:AraC family transcriptional regulator ligand-binding domain-containing protein [Polyangiaceae bacterium]
MSTWYTNHVRGPVGEGPLVECWLASSKPQHTAEYDRTFTRASLRFGAPFDAFVFPRECLDAPLPTADATVHSVLTEHLLAEAAHLASKRTFAAWVYDIASRELSTRSPSASSVARSMRMSVRTLARRLDGEGTSF